MSASDEQTQPPVENALDIEEIDVDFYRSLNELWVPPGGRGVFGGQVIGQALVAATKTVEDPFLVHSLHSYFLLPGDNTLPIIYKVTRSRDGKSFKTRTVVATQRGKIIYLMVCSFQLPELGLEHQYKMPAAPEPETLKNEEVKLNEWLLNPSIPGPLKKMMAVRLSQPIPIEIKRTVPVRALLSGKPLEPKQAVWIKAKGNLGDSPALHQCVAAYASDHVFLTTSLLAHGITSYSGKLTQMATIDHSMWFHAPFRADEWLLFEMESPRTGNSRGLVTGRIYTRDGRLVVSCAQEGLIRTKLTSDSQKVKSKL